MLLGDHGDLVTIQLFDETLKVPLLLKLPPRGKTLGAKHVSDIFVEANLDLMPTILDVCGIDEKIDIQGKSLFQERRSFAISESFFENIYTVSVRDAIYRYIAKIRFNCNLPFSEIDSNIEREELYQVLERRPELLINSPKEEILFGYRQIVLKHIEEAKAKSEALLGGRQ
jgi:hypothetical protein